MVADSDHGHAPRALLKGLERGIGEASGRDCPDRSQILGRAQKDDQHLAGWWIPLQYVHLRYRLPDLPNQSPNHGEECQPQKLPPLNSILCQVVEGRTGEVDSNPESDDPQHADPLPRAPKQHPGNAHQIQRIAFSGAVSHPVSRTRCWSFLPRPSAPTRPLPLAPHALPTASPLHLSRRTPPPRGNRRPPTRTSPGSDRRKRSEPALIQAGSFSSRRGAGSSHPVPARAPDPRSKTPAESMHHESECAQRPPWSQTGSCSTCRPGAYPRPRFRAGIPLHPSPCPTPGRSNEIG